MNLHKLFTKKRAVSPVVAAILLIGLAVAAGSIVYFVVLPMMSTETTGGDVEITFRGNSTNTAYKFYVINSGTSDITIASVIETALDSEGNVTAFAPAEIGGGTAVEITVTTDGAFIDETDFKFDFTDFSKTITVAATDFD